MAVFRTTTALSVRNTLSIDFVDDFIAVTLNSPTRVVVDQGDSTNIGRVTQIVLGSGLSIAANAGTITSIETRGSNGASVLVNGFSESVAVLNQIAENDFGAEDAITNFILRGDDSLFGSAGADFLGGNGGNDTIFGEGGRDRLEGNDGADIIDGGIGNDTLQGGADNDTLIGGAGGDVIDGGDGFDFVSFAAASRRVQVDTTNRISGIGDAAGDTYTSIEGIIGTDFNDNLRGGDEANVIEGGRFSDRLFGRGGNDTLDGGLGADALYGNSGADEMTGGAGRDRFIYFNQSETGVGQGNRDIITDFDAAAGERMEISRFDADITQGRNQAFDFIGLAAFSNTAGELRADQSSGTTTIVQGDVNGDGVADFEIELTGLIDLTAANFLL